MIPPRPLKRVSFGNGVGLRVSACRKRLRYSRTGQRPPVAGKPGAPPVGFDSRSTPDRNTPGAILAATISRKEAEGT